MADPVPHVLIVEPFDPDDDTDRYEIEHPANCPTIATHTSADGQHVAWEYRCAVAHYEYEEGVSGFFRHADDPAPDDPYLPAVGVGRHLIEAWHRALRHVDGTEYEGGLRLAEVGRG